MEEIIGEALAMHSPLPGPHCDCGRQLMEDERDVRMCTYCQMYGDQPCAPVSEDAMTIADPIIGRTRHLLFGHNDDSIYGINGDSGHDNHKSAAEDAFSEPMNITVDHNSIHLRSRSRCAPATSGASPGSRSRGAARSPSSRSRQPRPGLRNTRAWTSCTTRRPTSGRSSRSGSPP